MKPTNNKIIGYWHYGIILTYASAIAGIVGIIFSAMGMPGVGIICLYISGTCDAFDGAVAKSRKDRTDDDKLFGAMIDSASDLIAFGIAPIMVGVGLELTQWYFIIIYCMYGLNALIRLSYYNVTEEEVISEGSKRKCYEGLPVTNITFILPPLYVVATCFLGDVVNLPVLVPILIGVGLGVTALLFIIRFRCPKARASRVAIMIGIAVIVMSALYVVRYFVFGVHMI